MNATRISMEGITDNDLQIINYFINSKLQMAHFMKEYGLRLASPSSAYLGFSAFFLKHGEYSEHRAMKMAFFVQELGGTFMLSDIKTLNQPPSDPVTALETIIGLEEQILGNLKVRMMEVHDPAIDALMGHLMKMMALHLGAKKSLFTRANRVRNDPAGLQHIDRDLLLIEALAKHHRQWHDHHHHHLHHEDYDHHDHMKY